MRARGGKTDTNRRKAERNLFIIICNAVEWALASCFNWNEYMRNSYSVSFVPISHIDWIGVVYLVLNYTGEVSVNL